jgi:hypothetical protein
MSESLHQVGDQHYKVDHENKKVYRKQLLSVHNPPSEVQAHPEGYKWLETGGDYEHFMRFYAPAVSPEPTIGEAPVLNAIVDTPPDEPEAPLPEVAELLSSAELSGKKLKK